MTTFVEVGPGNVLSGLVKRIDRSVRTISVNDLAEPARSVEEALALTLTLRSLEGKIALVTGASRGIGRAIAVELAAAGATVVVGYRSGQDEAEAVAAEIGGRAVQADVSEPGGRRSALVEEAGDLDILVNNAGLTRDGAARAHDRRGLARR